MLKACSHTVIATNNVNSIAGFFQSVFDLTPHFANDMFCEFVLSSSFRIAFFKPVGESKKRFDASGTRKAHSLGLTVQNVKEFYEKKNELIRELGGELSGPPKEHSWGEASFLLVDPDGNRWEITQSPSKSGFLVNRE